MIFCDMCLYNVYDIDYSFADNMVPGCYAVSVTGKLPMHIIRELKARGVEYVSRDRSQQL